MAQSVQVFCHGGSDHARAGAASSFPLCSDRAVAHDERPEDLKPLYRFFDKVRNHHIYTTDEQELANWRLDQNLKEQVIVGDVASTEIPGTVRLWRATRQRDGRQFYYTQAPGKAKGVVVDSEKFRVFVWKRAGDDRVGIFGSTWIDGTDSFFDRDREKVRKYTEATKTALGIERRHLGQNAIFYVYRGLDEVEESK